MIKSQKMRQPSRNEATFVGISIYYFYYTAFSLCHQLAGFHNNARAGDVSTHTLSVNFVL